MSDQAAESPSLTTPPRRRFRHRLRRLLRAAVIAYMIVCIAVFFLQDWLIFPGHSHQGQKESEIPIERDTQTLTLTTAGGDQVAAIFGTALLPDGTPDANAPHRPTILYFYGNASTVAWSMGEFDHFRRLDANVMIPDFVGFGMSTGKPSEKTLYATADCAYEYLTRRRDIDSTKIVSVGWSLGAAVAVDLASRKSIAGLATFNAFTTLPKEARQFMPWLPTTLLIKYQFDNLSKIATFHGPTFICNGMRDTLIPPTMSDQLASVAAGPVTRLRIDAADHNSIFIAAADQPFSALGTFIDEIAGASSNSH